MSTHLNPPSTLSGAHPSALLFTVTELVGWIRQDYGLSEMDAYELLTKVAHIRLSEMVDPNYVVVASVEKKYLPAKRAPAAAPTAGSGKYNNQNRNIPLATVPQVPRRRSGR